MLKLRNPWRINAPDAPLQLEKSHGYHGVLQNQDEPEDLMKAMLSGILRRRRKSKLRGENTPRRAGPQPEGPINPTKTHNAAVAQTVHKAGDFYLPKAYKRPLPPPGHPQSTEIEGPRHEVKDATALLQTVRRVNRMEPNPFMPAIASEPTYSEPNPYHKPLQDPRNAEPIDRNLPIEPTSKLKKKKLEQNQDYISTKDSTVPSPKTRFPGSTSGRE